MNGNLGTAAQTGGPQTGGPQTGGPQTGGPLTGGSLRAVGADLAFSDRADFSGLTRSEPLKLQFATQKATLVVDELGTEPAALTAIGAMAASAPPALRSDRPFYAVVYDTPTATPLFSHVCGRPLETLTRPDAGSVPG